MRRQRLGSSILLSLGLGCAQPSATLPEVSAVLVEHEPRERDPRAELDAYAEAVGALLEGRALEPRDLPLVLVRPAEPALVGFYGDAGVLAEITQSPAAADGPLRWHTLAAAIATGLAELGPEGAGEVRRVSVEFAHEFTYFDALDAGEWEELVGVDRHDYARSLGLLGDAVGIEGFSAIRSPSAALASNLNFEAHFGNLRQSWRLSSGQLRSAALATFETEPVLVTLDPLTATPMFRGNVLVTPEEVTPEAVAALAEGAAGWLRANIDARGRLLYGYRPSEAREDSSDNAIRQWNATRTLLVWEEAAPDPELAPLILRNVEHNLAQTFHFEGPLGLIELGGRVKLGGLALAGLALHRHDRARWAPELAGLRASIDSLFHPDGSFTSYLRGSSKETWNFYPGEVLLFWAELYAADPEPELLRDYELAFGFYREWHLDPRNRKPAFVPWHLLAHAQLIAALAGSEPALEAELRAFCFELADELLPMQQQEGEVVAPDEQGRFYAPEEGWGTASSGSTGIYTWSLVAAYALARDAGELERAERYRLAVLGGLRSLMQLQFVDELDMFYLPAAARERVQGGLRTNVTNNRIRVDNVHYALLAATAALAQLGPEAFAASGPS